MDKPISTFLRSCEAEGLSLSTIGFYRQHLADYSRWAIDKDWLSVDTLREYFAHQQSRVKKGEIQPETAHARYRTLRAFFTWLVDQEIIERSPLKKLKPPKVPKKIPHRVTVDEFDKLLGSIDKSSWFNVRDRLIITMLWYCALRCDELCKLDVQDVDLSGGLLAVRHSKSEARFVPLLPEVKLAFAEYIYMRPGGRGRLFVSATSHQTLRGELTTSGIRQMLADRCAACGLRRLNPHAFRHGIAMHLLNEKGADMSLVSAILGHKDVQTTERYYADWTVGGMKRQYERLMKASD